MTLKGLYVELGDEEKAKRKWSQCAPLNAPTPRKLLKGTIYSYLPVTEEKGKNGEKIVKGGFGKVCPDDSPDEPLHFTSRDIGSQVVAPKMQVTFLRGRNAWKHSAEDIMIIDEQH